MRELFEICPKIEFFKPFWCFLSFEGSEHGQKRCKILCSYVSGTIWKIPCLSPEKMTIFLHLDLFFCLSLPKIWHSHSLLKST